MKMLSDLSQIQALWEKMSSFPGGKTVFSTALGKFIPYTGSVFPIVQQFGEGRAEVQLKDKRRVRNHLNCIHAIALANIGELSTGLATTSRLQDGQRMILVDLQVPYHKKARGTLTAKAECPPFPESEPNFEMKVDSEIYNETGDIVCSACATWKVSKNA